jgi:hypothetical protein
VNEKDCLPRGEQSIAPPHISGHRFGLSFPAELFAQFVLRSHQDVPAGRWEVLAGPINVEGEHGKRGAERIGLATAALFG